MIITLTHAEMRPAVDFAVGCVFAAHERPNAQHRGETGNRWNWDDAIKGFLAEIAVSKVLGLPFAPATFTDRPDVGPFEVRATHYWTGKLAVRPADKLDRNFLLVCVDEPRFNIVGWLPGWEVKASGTWEQLGHGLPAWYAEQSILVPFDLAELPDSPIAVR